MDIVRPNYAFDPPLLPSPCKNLKGILISFFSFALSLCFPDGGVVALALQPPLALLHTVSKIGWQRRGGKRVWGNGIVHNLCHVSVLICTLFVVLYYCTQ
ncbi:hypothetical protein AALO_G00291930 [Alosa alosa]|uniref:Transmembrane protein n=1 Tax=Alosa alosa TaxID=278164 RepID=A0AAV6FLJ9_9TELE|nr:hypothetical protein AALO_G00291930 [Alosa alosa]